MDCNGECLCKYCHKALTETELGVDMSLTDMFVFHCSLIGNGFGKGSGDKEYKLKALRPR